MNKKKITALVSFPIVIVIAILSVYFYLTPISKNIDVIITGVQFRMTDSPEDYELKEITIKGTTNHFLFGNKVDYYTGRFSIEGYDYTFDRLAGFGLRHVSEIPDLLFYLRDTTGVLGVIRTAGVEEFMIYVFEHNSSGSGSWNYNTSLVICAPAYNREEGDKIIERLAVRDEWAQPPIDSD